MLLTIIKSLVEYNILNYLIANTIMYLLCLLRDLCKSIAQSHTQQSSCFVGQPDVSTLSIADLAQPTLVSSNRRQYIFPDIRFEGCNGIITKLNFIASQWNDMETVDPQIQLWNRTNGMDYHRVSYIDIDITRLDGAGEGKFYSYTVDPPLPFQSGNILGVFSPRGSMSRLRINFLNTGAETSYRSGRTNIPLEMVTFSEVNSNNVPLLNVETGQFFFIIITFAVYPRWYKCYCRSQSYAAIEHHQCLHSTRTIKSVCWFKSPVNGSDVI